MKKFFDVLKFDTDLGVVLSGTYEGCSAEYAEAWKCKKVVDEAIKDHKSFINEPDISALGKEKLKENIQAISEYTKDVVVKYSKQEKKYYIQ